MGEYKRTRHLPSPRPGAKIKHFFRWGSQNPQEAHTCDVEIFLSNIVGRVFTLSDKMPVARRRRKLLTWTLFMHEPTFWGSHGLLEHGGSCHILLLGCSWEVYVENWRGKLWIKVGKGSYLHLLWVYQLCLVRIWEFEYFFKKNWRMKAICSNIFFSEMYFKFSNFKKWISVSG